MEQGRIPPNSLEAEQAVIGAIFIEAEAFATVAERLTSADFYRTSHQIIFATMLDLFEKGIPIDLVTVTRSLIDSDKMSIVGDPKYLTDLASSVPTAANIDYYSK